MNLQVGQQEICVDSKVEEEVGRNAKANVY